MECVANFSKIPCRGRLEKDHIYNRSTYPELKKDPNNIQLLCQTCHRIKTDNPRISAILGLKGERAKIKWEPITEEKYAQALEEWETIKGRMIYG